MTMEQRKVYIKIMTEYEGMSTWGPEVDKQIFAYIVRRWESNMNPEEDMVGFNVVVRDEE